MEIWKYILQPSTNIIEMPIQSEVLTVQTQYNQVCLWAAVCPAKPTHERVFIAIPTGREYAWTNLRYIGTCQLESETLVFHIFEKRG